MTVVVYRSTDASAPVLTGQIGSLVALLDACLVTGYGAKPAAGWTKPFVGTNEAVFRNNSVTGNGIFFKVNDNASGTGVGKEARVRYYENMTSVLDQDGDHPVPTPLQLSSGLIIKKSFTADSTPRNWTLVSDDIMCYLMVQTGVINGIDYSAFCIGDFFSYITNDNFSSIIIGRELENSTVSSSERIPLLYPGVTGGIGSSLAGHYITRIQNGLGSSAPASKHTDSLRSYATNWMGLDGLPYPDPVTNALLYARVTVTTYQTIRGHLPGMWCPMHYRPLANEDIVLTNDGRTLQAFMTPNSSQVLIEISDTWYT